MKQRSPIRRVRVGIVLAAAIVVVPAASAQEQDVQSRVVTHQVAVAQPAQVSLSDWETRYAEALEAAKQLQSADDTRELGEQLERDLQAYDKALRAYQRVSERLRHKDRALTAAIGRLESSGSVDSRTLQTVSNVSQAGHEVHKAIINNMR